MQTERIKQLNEKAKSLDALGIIKLVFDEFASKVTFATSLGEEDQVITDMIAKAAAGIEIFTLDTGRLFVETYDLMAKNQKKYNKLNFKIFYPNTQRVEEMVRTKGINLFYESLCPFGFLGLGNKESLLYADKKKHFQDVDRNEKIFMKNE